MEKELKNGYRLRDVFKSKDWWAGFVVATFMWWVFFLMMRPAMAMNITMSPGTCTDINETLTLCAGNITFPQVNVTCNPMQNLTIANITVNWSNNATLENRYYTCRDELSNCSSNKEMLIGNNNVCLREVATLESFRMNATNCQTQLGTCQSQAVIDKNRFESDKNQFAMIAAAIGLAVGYFLFKKKEPEEAKDVTGLPKVM